MGSLSGKTAIVTGAGRPNGMGFGAAKALAALGANVVVTDLVERRADLVFEDFYSANDSLESLEERARELEALGVRSMAIAVDVTKPDQIVACVETVVEEFEGVDVLFNNAGTPIGVAPFLQLDDEMWDLSYQVILKGTADFCKAVIPVMQDRGGGSIINNGSVWALKVGPEAAAYVAAKAGVVALSKALAAEFATSSIRCNCVCPGTIQTEMNKVDVRLAMERGIDVEAARTQLVNDISMGRMGDAAEVGAVVAFLASDEASYLNGVVLPVDGGVMFGL